MQNCEIYIQQKQIEKQKQLCFFRLQHILNIIEISNVSSRLEDTIKKPQQNIVIKINTFQHFVLKSKPIYSKTAQIQGEKLMQKEIDVMVRPFQAMTQSKSSHTKHSRSLSNDSPMNKFYAFKKIREQRCKQQSSGGKVLKSLKVDQQNERTERKRIIQHLDQVETVQSKDSPRSSLNSLGVPEVQQSLIIMKGADLYDDLMKQNKVEKSRFFTEARMQKSIYETPAVRKGLCESTYWQNHENTVHYQAANCFTDPKKVFYGEDKQQGFNDDRKNIHNFLRHLNSSPVGGNKLSFLKAKKVDRKF